jgi:hypothetical protein
MNCKGKGTVENWVFTEDIDLDPTIGRLCRTEQTCPECHGKGYTKYPVFTVEEAKVIAKHFRFEITGDTDD